jgi:methylated-DNA-protein-cysteine methyltransferase related protein
MSYSNPPDPKHYNEQVYRVARAIPEGRVMAYGHIAHLILPPLSVPPDTYLKLSPRWVGSAMASCPDDVPWQRVINSQGKISERPGFGVLVQRKLLEDEGVVFDERDRVDLKRYGWQPSAAWLRANGFIAPETGADADAGPAEQGRLF